MRSDGTHGQRGRILVVDDDYDIRELLALALGLEGFVVDVAANGLAALNKVRQQRPDAIILDLNMPRMGGEEFLFARSAGVKTPGVPVIVISASSEALRAEDLGVDAYIAKPFDIDDLVHCVEELVAAPTRVPVAAPLDMHVAELHTVADSLTHVLGVALGNVEMLADDPSDPDERRVLTARVLASAQRGSTLVRRLKHLVDTLQ